MNSKYQASYFINNGEEILTTGLSLNGLNIDYQVSAMEAITSSSQFMATQIKTISIGSCAICMKSDGLQFKTGNCGHVVCSSCISMSPSCSFCKAPLSNVRTVYL